MSLFTWGTNKLFVLLAVSSLSPVWKIWLVYVISSVRGSRNKVTCFLFFLNWCSSLSTRQMHENPYLLHDEEWRGAFSPYTWRHVPFFKAVPMTTLPSSPSLNGFNTQCLCSKSASYAFLPISLTLVLSVGLLLQSSTRTTLLPCSCCGGFASTLHAFKREDWFTKEHVHLTCKSK